MTTSLKQVSGSLRLRRMLCVFFFIAAGLVVLAGTASSREIAQGGSASPLGAVASAKAAEDDGKRIAGGADISSERFRGPNRQRVEDNAFHLKIAP